MQSYTLKSGEKPFEFCCDHGVPLTKCPVDVACDLLMYFPYKSTNNVK